LQTKATKCHKCDCEAAPKVDGNVQGIYCQKCEKWLVVTTYIPEILTDSTEYKIILVSGDFKNTDQIKVVADIGNINFIDARKLLKENEIEIYSGNAQTVKNAISNLVRANLVYRVEPDFPY